MILTQCKDTNDIENTQIYFHEIYENTQIWMFESFITIITIVASHQSGIYGLRQKSIKLLHNSKSSDRKPYLVTHITKRENDIYKLLSQKQHIR